MLRLVFQHARFVIVSECLSRLILFGEASVRRALDEFLKHYHHERDHQGNKILLFPAARRSPDQPPLNVTSGQVVCLTFSNLPHGLFDLTERSEKRSERHAFVRRICRKVAYPGSNAAPLLTHLKRKADRAGEARRKGNDRSSTVAAHLHLTPSK